MTTRPLLHGLTDEESVLAIWKLLFSPPLREHFGSDWTYEWSSRLAANFADGNQVAFSDQYNSLAPDVEAALSRHPKYSMANAPWSMASLDMRLGLIPWITPIFDQAFAMLLSEGSALEKHFGDVLPFAFFLRGGPGDSKETAFRVCAPANAVRAGAEHWLMRAYLWRREQVLHATLAPDETGRTFSLHEYIDQTGIQKNVFFETTHSFGREKDDFQDFLHDGSCA